MIIKRLKAEPESSDPGIHSHLDAPPVYVKTVNCKYKSDHHLTWKRKMRRNCMKKIALALVALLIAMSPLAAGESWIGITTGPAFEITAADEFNNGDMITDFNWDLNIEGAYYFDEAETLGIGGKLGFGFNYATTYRITIPAPGNSTYFFDNPIAGTKIAPAVTFQYRLGISDALDLRFGAGFQYVYTIGNPVSISQQISFNPDRFFTFYQNYSIHTLELIANADAVYSFGNIQVFGGIDLGVSLMNYVSVRTESNGRVETAGDTLDCFQMSITPRIGVSYAF